MRRSWCGAAAAGATARDSGSDTNSDSVTQSLYSLGSIVPGSLEAQRQLEAAGGVASLGPLMHRGRGELDPSARRRNLAAKAATLASDLVAAARARGGGDGDPVAALAGGRACDDVAAALVEVCGGDADAGGRVAMAMAGMLDECAYGGGGAVVPALRALRAALAVRVCVRACAGGRAGVCVRACVRAGVGGCARARVGGAVQRGRRHQRRGGGAEEQRGRLRRWRLNGDRGGRPHSRRTTESVTLGRAVPVASM
jgi:hypothetical protein